MPVSRSAVLIIIFFWILEAGAQHAPGIGDSISVVAGAEYRKSRFYQWFWGKNRRKEWTTPVRVPVVHLDKVNGGLMPYKKGGGNESKTLRLKSATGKEYVLHSINKSRDAVIPGLLKNSFFASIIRDGVSMSYPYGAFAVSAMLSSAGIYHTQPKLVYIPRQQALDSFNQVYGDNLYLLEERPEGDWSDDAPYLGGFANFYNTNDVAGKLLTDPRFKADQHAYIKCRLLDILIADWDRNYDNWRWAAGKNDSTRFIPIPRDRDQAFFTSTGPLMRLIMPLTGVGFMKNFGYTINVSKLTKQDREVDEFFANEMSLADWRDAAKQLQEELTDSVITRSVSGLPQSIFAISGNELVDKLKARRDGLMVYATDFYNVLAKHVKITGTGQKDLFRVKALPGGNISVEIFAMTGNEKESTPYYSRIFSRKETRRITLNGNTGNDVFDIDAGTRSIKITKLDKKISSPVFE